MIRTVIIAAAVWVVLSAIAAGVFAGIMRRRDRQRPPVKITAPEGDVRLLITGSLRDAERRAR